MFGNLVAASSLLTHEEEQRYKASYCGLCRGLKERHGPIAQMTLNYDMTFLIILLESLYEPEEIKGNDACIAHPFEKREWWRSDISNYAADMNVALAYLKTRDDWNDEKKLSAAVAGAFLKKRYEKIAIQYPRQCSAMERSITELGEIEKNGIEDPDAAAATFGALLGEVFVYRDDRWKAPLYALGNSIGRFIYLLDACLDLEKDIKKGNYNPFKKYYGQDNRERFREYLKLYLADAAEAFEFLPLVQDISILKNIVYAGLWTAFNNEYIQKGDANGTGSI